MATIEEKNLMRLKFLNALFDQVDGSKNSVADGWPIAKSVGIENQQDAVDVFQYLVDEGLTKPGGMGAHYRLSHLGIKEIETARKHPEQPTSHFPSYQTINVNATNSQVVIGSSRVDQTMTFSETDIGALQKFVHELQNKFDDLHLSSDQQSDLQEQITTLQSQLKTNTPRSSIVTAVASEIKVILQSAAGSAASSFLLAELTKLLPHL